MTSKTPAPDIRFAVTITDSDRFGGMTQYRHFAARAYILARDKHADRGPELHDPGSYSIDAGPARCLKGLEITAQADDDSMKRIGNEWYGWTVKYDRSEITLRDAEEILPVLRKIYKRMAKLSDELGRPATLAQFCAYAVSAVTAGQQPFLRAIPEAQDYEGTGYRSMDANALDWHIMADTSDWRKEHGISPAD